MGQGRFRKRLIWAKADLGQGRFRKRQIQEKANMGQGKFRKMQIWAKAQRMELGRGAGTIQECFSLSPAAQTLGNGKWLSLKHHTRNILH